LRYSGELLFRVPPGVFRVISGAVGQQMFKISPQIAGAMKAVAGVVDVETL
jgi:hypothetical protein